MKLPSGDRLAGRLLAALTVLLPFLMFAWMLPFLSPMTVGRDYTLFPIQYQMELFYSISRGTFPLYAPGFAGGQAASALTLGQVYHPLSHLSAHMPGYWSGLALEWNTFFRLLFLGASQWAFFSLLRRWMLEPVTAFLLSFVAVYNLRTLDLFRYGASLESWTGFLLLCSAVGWLHLRRHSLLPRLAVTASTYWLICSGHPQMMYYGLVGAIVFSLLIPFLVPRLLGEKTPALPETLSFWAGTALAAGLGTALAAVYVLPYYFDFITTNSLRVEQGYQWADGYRDTFAGTVNNFFYPLRSDVHGAFGGSSLLLAALFLPLLRIFRFRIPAPVWGLWACTLLTLVYMQGSRTPLHYLAWKYIPLASSFRVAGRVAIVMPMLCVLLLAWSARAPREGAGPPTGRALSLLALAALLATALYCLLPSGFSSDQTVFSARAIREVPPWVEPVTLLLGAMTLAGIAARGVRWPGVIACLCALGQVGLSLSFGTWVEAKTPTPTLREYSSWKEASLDYRFSAGEGLYSDALWQQMNRSVPEPYLGKVYPSYRPVSGQEEAFDVMAAGRAPGEVIVEGFSAPPGPFGGAAEGSPGRGSVELLFSSFNRLDFSASSTSPAFFGLSFPYTGHWRAEVNGEETPLYRANGSSHALLLPPGESAVVFRYWSPAAFRGVLISSLALALIAALVLRGRTFRGRSALLVLAPLALAVALPVLWYRSLYNGENLGTRYLWRSSDLPDPSNIAYYRLTASSSVAWPESPHLTYSGRAVDGSRGPGPGFTTAFEDSPWWLVDLGRRELVGSVVVYARRRGKGWNGGPIAAGISDDREEWFSLGRMEESLEPGGFRLDLEQPRQGRYILLQSPGAGRLAFDEVEIYPPGEGGVRPIGPGADS